MSKAKRKKCKKEEHEIPKEFFKQWKFGRTLYSVGCKKCGQILVINTTTGKILPVDMFVD